MLSKPTVGCLCLYSRDQGAAHDYELQKVFGPQSTLAPQIEHGGVAIALVWHDRNDCGAINAFNRFEQITRQQPSGHLYCRPTQSVSQRSLLGRCFDLIDGHAWKSPSSCATQSQPDRPW